MCTDRAGHRAPLTATILRQHQIKPPSEKPTATVRYDVLKSKRYRSRVVILYLGMGPAERLSGTERFSEPTLVLERLELFI